MSGQETLDESKSLGNHTDFSERAAVLKFKNQKPEVIHRHQAPYSSAGAFNSQNAEIALFSRQEVRIGRDNNCDVVIPDKRISKQHFRIYSIVYDEREHPSNLPLIYCEDLQSTNGTFINDVMIGNINTEKIGYLLSDGDVIQILPYWTFHFRQPTEHLAGHRKALFQDIQYFQDRYAISDRVLGGGFYGAVYLAEEVQTRKQVACKIVDLKAAARQLSKRQTTSERSWRDDAELDKEARQKVFREIKILAQFNHPHIVDLRKAFCSDNTLYMIISLAAGGDLFSYLEANGGRLDDWNGRVISRQIVLALEHLHSKGIGHRDIKPENVLVTQNDFGSRIILTDFGFANYINTSTRRMMSVVGTEGCAAPEVWAARGHSLAADMWSLGVLIVRILTGLPMDPNIDAARLDDLEISDYFIIPGDARAREQWLELRPRALHLVHQLLFLAPESRISAFEALNHKWYKMPRTEAAALEEGYQRVVAFWKPREAGEDVVEALPGNVVLSTAPANRAVSKSRLTKLPDVSLSPYFGLERHLMQRTSLTRQNILANLSESGSHFIPAEPPQKAKPPAGASAQGTRYVPVISVGATNLLGMSQTLESPQTCHQGFESAIESLRSERAYGFDLDLEDIAVEAEPGALTDTFSSCYSDSLEMDLAESLRAHRRESWCPADRRIHDVVASQLPRFATAKVMKDVITRMKESAATDMVE